MGIPGLGVLLGREFDGYLMLRSSGEGYSPTHRSNKGRGNGSPFWGEMEAGACPKPKIKYLARI